MAYEINDLKGIFILVLFAIPMIASMNINCSGKAFHCVNSTHFMICVDLGGGLSTTIDDFILPCPARTVCHEHNIFECEFPQIDVSSRPLQVIGVYKQSDTSEPPLVTKSVTAPMPTSEILSVFEKNITNATTLPIPEEVTTVLKLDVLEDIKKSIGVNSESTTETSFQVTSSFIDNTNDIVNDVKTSNNTKTTAIDNNNIFVSAVNTSVHKTVTSSFTDKPKSVDKVTSVIGLINLISTNPQSVASTKPSFDVSTSLDTFYDNITTTTEKYISRKVATHEKVENVTEKLALPTATIFSDTSVITDKVGTTAVANKLIENDIKNKIKDINKSDSGNQFFSKSNSTTELVPETTTEYLASVKIINISEPITVDVSIQITTDKTSVPLGLIDLISTDLIKSVPSTNLSSNYLNNFYDNTATTIDQNTLNQETKLSDKPVLTEKENTTPILDTYNQSFNKYKINNHSFSELNFTGEMTTIEKVPETNTDFFIPEPMTVNNLQKTTEKSFVPIIMEENIIFTTETTVTSRNLINNDSLSDTIVVQPLEIIITTDSPTELTDNLYQMDRELNQSLISTVNNTADSMNITERVKADNVSSADDVINDKGTYSALFSPTTTETLQNEFTARAIVVTNTIVKDFTAQSDIVTNISTIHGTAQKVTDQKNKIPDSRQPDNLETVTSQENLSVAQWTKTVKNLTGITTYWNNLKNSAITPLPRDVTEKTSLTESVKSINQGSKSDSNVVITPDVLPKALLPQTLLSNHYVTELTSNTPKPVYTAPLSVDSIKTFETESTNTPETSDIITVLTPDFKIETSTTFPLDVTHFTNVKEVRDFAITTTPPQELISQKMYTVIQLNTRDIVDLNRISTPDVNPESSTAFPVDVTHFTNVEEVRNFATTTTPPQKLTSLKMDSLKQLNTEIDSDSVTSAVPSAGYMLNTKDKDRNTINEKASVKIETIITNDGTNEIGNKTEAIINPINGKNSDNIISLSTANTNKDERIKIVSVFDIVNSSVNAMPNGTLQPPSSNPSLSNDYIKTTKPQDSSVYETRTEYIPGYKFAEVGESVTKYPEKILSLADKEVTNPVMFTPSTHILPIIDIKTENIKYVIGTEAPLPSTIDSEHIVSTNDYNKLSYVETESSVSSISGFTSGTAVTPEGVRTVPDYGEGTMIQAAAFMMSSTQIMPQAVIDNNIKKTRDSPHLPSKVIGTQTVQYDSTDPSLPISVPAVQEPTHTTNLFAQTTFAAIGKTNKDVLPGNETTNLPQYVISKANNNNFQSISDITTETITNSLTKPDAIVENIKVVRDKLSESYFGKTVLSDVMSNNPTTNNSSYNVSSVKNIIDHENIVVRAISKNIAQNTTVTSTKLVNINKIKSVNHTENDCLRSDVSIDSVKIKDLSIEQELTPKSDMNLQNKSDSPIISKINPKDGKPVNIIEYEVAAVTTIPSHGIETQSDSPKKFTQSETITTKDNNNAETDSSVNANIEKFDVKQYRVKNVTDNYSKSNIKANLTTSYRNLSLHNNTSNDELAQHLISRNHTITTEVQSHLNENDKQSNKTNDELTLIGTSMHNPNLTIIKLNAGSKDKSFITGAASLFNCSNHTRGKYADKKDCRKFYTCIGNLQPIIGTCPNNTVFSEINKQCTRNLSHCVRNNQFRCLFDGRFSDFFKDNIYYICVKHSKIFFIRYKLQCQDDYHLNKVSVKCEKNEEISTQSASSVSETNTDESKPKIKSEKITSTDDFECENEGKFPYAKDCTKYYTCTKIKNVYRRKIKKCANDEVYDKKKKKCVDSDSGEC